MDFEDEALSPVGSDDDQVVSQPSTPTPQQLPPQEGGLNILSMLDPESHAMVTGGGRGAGRGTPGGGNKPPVPVHRQTQFQKATAPPPPKPQQPEKELTTGEALQQAGKNFLPSLGSMAGSMVNAAVHPVETVGTLGHLVQGAGSQVAGKLGAQQDPNQKAKDEQLIRALGAHYKQAYGSWAGFKKYLANDPASLLSDIGSVASMGFGAAGTGANVLSKGAEAAKLGTLATDTAKASGLAGSLQKAGQVASKASKAAGYIDPATLGLKGVGLIGKGVGHGVLGTAATSASVTTGKRIGAIMDAAEAGASRDPELRGAFRNMMTGASDPSDLADAIVKHVDDLKEERNAAFEKDISAMSKQGKKLDWSKVQQSIHDARATVNHKHSVTGNYVSKDDVANRALDDIQSSFNEFQGDNSLQALHAFKQAVGNARAHYGSGPTGAGANRVLTNVYHGALGAIGDVHSEYAHTMDAYGKASDAIKAISDAFKTGGRNANAEKTLNQLLSTKTGSSKETLLKQLGERDRRIPYMLAGLELKNTAPSGVRGAMLSSPLSFAAPHAAFAAGLAASPRLAGSVAYNAGRASRYSSPLFSPMAAKSLRASGMSLDDQDAAAHPTDPNAPPAPTEGAEATNDPHVDTLKQRIAQHESGAKSYSAIGTMTPKGDVALGKYQIMRSNLPEWSKQALGREVSQEEFMNNPQIQEQIADHKIREYWSKYGNYNDVYSMWASGRPYSKGKNVVDPTTKKNVAQYVAEIGNENRAMRKSGGKVSDSRRHEYLVDRLMRLAKDAKKDSDNTTEPLLNVPDETIVKALNVAQQAI
jgi:hypothetical protein